MAARLRVSLICSALLITILLVVGAVLGKSEQQEGAYRPLAVYTEVLARIKSDYVEEPDIARVTQGALQGLVEYVDSASSYLTREQFGEYEVALANADGGTGLSTGMVVRKQGAYTSILAVLPGSPADMVGIRADSLLDAIDDVSTRVMPPAYLRASLSGEPGSSVKVMVRSPADYESAIEHTLVRDETPLPEVRSKMLEDGIAYVDADALGEDHVKAIADAIAQLEAEGAVKLILDLRGNALGAHENGIALADLFLDTGTLARLDGKNFAEKAFEASPEAMADGLRIAVVVDRPTSGAAEIAVAALQAAGRVTVVGEKTSGLAAVQETLRMDDGAALILSVANFHSPSGDVIHGEGVTPDREVSQRDLRRYRDVVHREFDNSEARRQAEEGVGDPFMDAAQAALAEDG